MKTFQKPACPSSIDAVSFDHIAHEYNNIRAELVDLKKNSSANEFLTLEIDALRKRYIAAFLLYMELELEYSTQFSEVELEALVGELIRISPEMYDDPAEISMRINHASNGTAVPKNEILIHFRQSLISDLALLKELYEPYHYQRHITTHES